MLSMLDLLETALPPRGTRKVRRIIRKRLGELRLTRDVQVQLGYCDQLIADFPQLAGFRKSLARQERRLRRRVRGKLRSLSPRKLDRRTDKLLDGLVSALDPDADTALGRGIHASLEDSWHRVLLRRARIDPKQTASIHRMRLAFKRFRYTAEIAASCFPQLRRERLKAMHAYQDRMGAIQDMETLLRSMMEFRRRSGRTSILVVENEIRRRRERHIDDFMQAADEIRFFWSVPQADSREVV